MERRREHQTSPPPREAMAELVRLGVVQPAASDVSVLDVVAIDGAPSTAASDMLAL